MKANFCAINIVILSVSALSNLLINQKKMSISRHDNWLTLNLLVLKVLLCLDRKAVKYA